MCTDISNIRLKKPNSTTQFMDTGIFKDANVQKIKDEQLVRDFSLGVGFVFNRKLTVY